MTTPATEAKTAMMMVTVELRPDEAGEEGEGTDEGAGSKPLTLRMKVCCTGTVFMLAEMTTALELALYVENTGILRVMTERDTTEQLAVILLEFT